MIDRHPELRLSRASGGVSQPTYSTLQVEIPKQAGPLGQVLTHWLHAEKTLLGGGPRCACALLSTNFGEACCGVFVTH